MSKEQENTPEEAGNIDWDALEANDAPQETEETVDQERIEQAKAALSEEDKSNPYPDDFLADWNVLLENIEDTEEEEDE